MKKKEKKISPEEMERAQNHLFDFYALLERRDNLLNRMSAELERIRSLKIANESINAGNETVTRENNLLIIYLYDEYSAILIQYDKVIDQINEVYDEIWAEVDAHNFPPDSVRLEIFNRIKKQNLRLSILMDESEKKFETFLVELKKADTKIRGTVN